jgi:hypothetical protein
MKSIATAIVAAISLALMLGGCATSGKPVDTAKLEQEARFVDLAYSTAKTAIVVYCVAAPNAFPCNNPGAMAGVQAARLGRFLPKLRARHGDPVAGAFLVYSPRLFVYH